MRASVCESAHWEPIIGNHDEGGLEQPEFNIGDIIGGRVEESCALFEHVDAVLSKTEREIMETIDSNFRED